MTFLNNPTLEEGKDLLLFTRNQNIMTDSLNTMQSMGEKIIEVHSKVLKNLTLEWT